MVRGKPRLGTCASAAALLRCMLKDRVLSQGFGVGDTELRTLLAE